MGRLIDADALIEEIKSLQVFVTGLRAGRGILNEYAKQYRESLLRIVDEQPTAYNVETVVDQLEEEREYSYADFDEYSYSYELDLTEEYDDFFHKGLERAMRIVKAGGING